jgi:hypothetical protein
LRFVSLSLRAVILSLSFVILSLSFVILSLSFVILSEAKDLFFARELAELRILPCRILHREMDLCA